MGLLSSLFGKRATQGAAAQARLDPTFDRTKVYPWVKVVFPSEGPSQRTEHVITGETFPINRPLVGDLSEFLVLDEGHGYRVLFDQDLPADLSQDALYDRARENLVRDVDFKFESWAPYFAMIVAGGNHEAGALCVPGLWDEQSKRLGGDLLVAVLAKDVVIFALAESEGGKSELKATIERTKGKLDRPLSSMLFQYHAASSRWSLAPSQ